MSADFPEKPDSFEEPVSWLAGRDMLTSAKRSVLSALSRSDPRNWMNPNVYPSAEEIKTYIKTRKEIELKDEDLKKDFLQDPRVDEFWREKTKEFWEWKKDNYAAWEKKADEPSENEFWFDYISDTGDGQKSVYNVGFICLSDLWCKKNSSGEVSFKPPNEKEKDAWQLLPRGSFLFVGGDTSYHVSDFPNNSYRFQLPFRWAFESVRKLHKKLFGLKPDINNDGTIAGKVDTEGNFLTDSEPARPLFGVPANHDYYDEIDGFNRQFRRPITPEHIKGDKTPPQLGILGFERKQEASYMALRLPFGWWMWGVDSELDKLDFRQEQFFKGLNENKVPEKLIVATPEPTTVFGQKPPKAENLEDEEKTSRYFHALGLKRPFMDEDMPEGCRLDLSGDIHHYERYWGTKNKRGDETEAAPDKENYASVVAGGGGAFLHPTHTIYNGKEDAIEAKVLYPTPKDSNDSIAERLFNLHNIFKGGYVFLFGAIFSGIIFFTLTLPQATRVLFNEAFFNKFTVLRIPSFFDSLCPCGNEKMYAVIDRYHFWILTAFLIVSVIFSVIGRASFGKAIKKIRSISLAERRAAAGKEFYLWYIVPKEMRSLTITVFALATIFFVIYVIYLLKFWERIDSAHPFAKHFLVLLHIVSSSVTFALSSQYSKFITEAYKGSTVKDRKFQKFFHIPLWVFNIIGLTVLLLGFGFYARQGAICVISDILLQATVLGFLFGLIYFGYGVGSGLQPNRLSKIWLGAIGAWHALLQLLVPVLYVRIGGWNALLILVVSVLVTSTFGKYSLGSVAMKKFPKLLVFIWFVYGSGLLALPFWMQHTTMQTSYNAGWIYVGHAALAIALGCVMSMAWLGWYLAVSLGFNSHPNEAGGAGRIEKFRHILRICLTENQLSVYVIAADETCKEAGNIHLRLIDNFALSVKQKP